jgi:hypothetical protein
LRQKVPHHSEIWRVRSVQAEHPLLNQLLRFPFRNLKGRRIGMAQADLGTMTCT